MAVTFRVVAPAHTPDDAPLHLAGDFQGWDPAHAGYALVPDGAGAHELSVDLRRGAIVEFKFARGAWERVERGPDGDEVENRRLLVEAAGTHRFVVARWADSPPSTLRGEVRTFSVPGFLDGRRVWAWVPPGYSDDPEARFPVLYMFDGQNVFDRETSFAGEWGADETASDLVEAGAIEPPIIVAADNGGAARFAEYTPWGDAEIPERGGDGDATLDAYADVLVPFVDAHFRTRPEPSARGLSGSSLGGLMAAYAAYARSATFGRFASLSPSVWVDERHLLRVVAERPKPAVRLWVDSGGAEAAVEDFTALRDALVADGFVEGEDLHAELFPGAGHDEPSWRARFGDVLRFLFPARD